MPIEYKSENMDKRSSRLPVTEEITGSNPVILAKSFINTTPYGLKVKMPDSVHVFLPGETIEFIEKVLGPGDAEKELARRERRRVMKSETSSRIARKKKGK